MAGNDPTQAPTPGEVMPAAGRTVADLPRHPRFISLEGGEGAGKTTVLQALATRLRDAGAEVVLTREPGGTPLAERIRALLLDRHDDAPLPVTELLLMFAARAQHVACTVQPALARGAWVISDRFTDSSYAYQGAGRGVDAGFIATLEREAVGLQPSLTLLLDLCVRVGRQRVETRTAGPDRIEAEQEAFFQRVREGFLARAAAEPDRIRVLDAGDDAAAVARAACEALDAHRARVGA